MKTETIQHVPVEQVKAAMSDMAEKHGTQNAAAKKIGIDKQRFSQILRGYTNPPKALLEFFGLESRQVYVKRPKGGSNA